MKEYTALDFYSFKILSLKELEKIILKNEKANNIYKILKNDIEPKINSLGINTYYVPLPMAKCGGYEIAFAYDYAEVKYKQPTDKLYFSFVFYLDKKAKKIEDIKPQITIAFYQNMNKDIKIKVIDIFEKYLFGFFYWNGSNRTYPIITYNKDNNIKHIDKTKLKDDDRHPCLRVKITTYYNVYKDGEFNKNYYIIKDFMLPLFKNYDAVLRPTFSLTTAFSNELVFSAYSFEYNDEIIQKVKDFLKSLDFIKTVEMTIEYSETELNPKKLYWKYTNENCVNNNTNSNNNDDNSNAITGGCKLS